MQVYMVTACPHYNLSIQFKNLMLKLLDYYYTALYVRLACFWIQFKCQ